MTLCTLIVAATVAQDARFGFQEVTPTPVRPDVHVRDVWTLKLTYRKPRLILTELPGQGRRLVWYMRYWLVNETGKPRRVVPKFTIVTKSGEVIDDIVLPRAERNVTIREFGARPPFELHNSVTISREPIPPTPEGGDSVEVHGVAFWDGGDALLEAKEFDVFVTGISNGYVKVDPSTETEAEPEMLVKTLRLGFFKPGDTINVNEKEVFLRGDPKWVFRELAGPVR